MGIDEKGSLRREHSDVDPGKGSDVMPPYSCSIDGHGCTIFSCLPVLVIQDLDTLDSPLFYDEAGDFGVDQDRCSMKLGIDHVRGAQSERVHRTVRNPDCTDDRRIGGWFHQKSLLGIDDVGFDAGIAAGLHESGLVIQIVFRESQEESRCVIDTMTGNLLENHVLLDAFSRRFPVRHSISRTAVQKAMIAAGRTGSYVIPFNKKHIESPETAVSCSSQTGDSSTDDDNIEFLTHLPVYSLIFVLNSFERLIGVSESERSNHSRASAGCPIMKHPRAML